MSRTWVIPAGKTREGAATRSVNLDGAGASLIRFRETSNNLPVPLHKWAIPRVVGIVALLVFCVAGEVRTEQFTEAQASNLFKSAQDDWKHQRWKDALAKHRQIANSSSQFASKAHIEIGKFYKYHGRWDAALAEYESAVKKAVIVRDMEDAETSIAAVHLSKGDYAKALDLFTQIIANTADWQQVKYCTYWTKELKRRMCFPQQPRCNTCGPDVLKEIFKLTGVPLPDGGIAAISTDDPDGASMDELRQKGEASGLQVYGVTLSLGQLKEIQKPLIALIEHPNHYVVIAGFDAAGLHVIDPAMNGARYVMPEDEFAKFWNGYSLVFSKPDPKSVLHRLTDTDLKKLKGRVCWCCPPGCNGDQCPNGDPDPDPGCPNPVLTINTVNLNLMAKENDLSYKGRGPGVELTRTYNADDPMNGAFGRSWSFSYGMTLTVNPGGSVDIRRETGTIHRFTSIGGGNYNSPVAIYDTLVQNGDGTYSLKIKADKTSQNFSAAGVLTSITDRNGNSVTLQYDAGKLVSITDAVGRITMLAYGANGKIASLQDPLGRTVNYTYDANDNLVHTVDMAGRTVDFAYDNPTCPGGTCSYMTSITTSKGTTRVTYTTSVEGFALASVTDPLGHAKLYSNPGSHASVAITKPNGNAIIYDNTSASYTAGVSDSAGQSRTYGYDSKGNRSSITDAKGHTTTLAYDAQGNVTRRTDAMGNAFQMFYDSHNNLTNAVDPLGRTTRYEYDANNNLTKITDARNGTVSFGYDGFGQMTSMTDTRTNTTAYAYDAAGNLNRMTNPVGGITTYSYDAVGRLTNLTDPKTNSFTYVYDGLDRLTEIQQPGGVLTRYIYDCCKLSNASNSTGLLRYQYDNANRLTQFINTENRSIGYDYDPNGNLTALTYPGGKVVQYQYDDGDRLSQVTDWLGNVTRYEYDRAGNLVRTVNGNGTVAAYGFDAANRLVSLVNLKPDASVLSRYQYTLDGRGNRINIAAFEPAAQGLTPTNVSYSYDADNRIQTATGATFTHDPNGNLTGIAGQKPTNFAYDGFNRLTQVSFTNYNAQYQYDAKGNRIGRVVNGTTTKFIVDPNASLSRLLAETDSAGAIVAYYVYGRGLISKIAPSGQAYFFHFDGLGSTTAMTDSSGSVVNKYAYEPFGYLSSGGTETVPNPFRYVGMYGVMDENNGLLFMRARYYTSVFARFLSQDPIGLTGGLNVYAYVANNPINSIDPTGLCAQTDWRDKIKDSLVSGIDPFWVSKYVQYQTPLH